MTFNLAARTHTLLRRFAGDDPATMNAVLNVAIENGIQIISATALMQSARGKRVRLGFSTVPIEQMESSRVSYSFGIRDYRKAAGMALPDR